MARAHVLVRLVPGLDASAVEQIRVIHYSPPGWG